MCWKCITELCAALGGIGTFGTLCFSIKDSRRKSKQIDKLGQINEQLVEAQYRPDLRIVTYPNPQSEINRYILIENNGEDVTIDGITGESVDENAMKTWFPWHLDKGHTMKIPLDEGFRREDAEWSIIIDIGNKINHHYVASIDGSIKKQIKIAIRRENDEK